MPRSPSGNGITDPVQIRALHLVTPKQFGILLGHGETTVQKWIRVGWVKQFTALDTSNVLIRIEEVERFLCDREASEMERRTRNRQKQCQTPSTSLTAERMFAGRSERRAAAAASSIHCKAKRGEFIRNP